MPIAFDCPYCHTPYRLRDELAGKRAKCKNPACGQLLAIPQPNVAGPPGANGKPKPPSSAEVEAAALAALADEAREEAPAAATIAMTCVACEHKWTEPVEKAGKNVLCPDCQTRQKVPIPKDPSKRDWRAGPEGPSLAKQNFEQPADVMNAEAKLVSGEALKKAGATNEEFEPIPLKRKAMWAAVVLAPLLLVGGGVWYGLKAWKGRGQDRFMEQALAGWEADGKELPPAEQPVCAAVLHLAAGEYELAQDRDRGKALERAASHFVKARAALQQAPAKDDPRRTTGPERAAAAAELAVAQVALGGTDADVNDSARYRWVPEVVNRPLRANEKPKTVHEELSRTLPLLQAADPDLKLAVLRRLARPLVKAGQAGLAADLPVMLFADADKAEARAWVALETFRLEPASDRPRQVADELRGQLEKGAGGGPAYQLLSKVAGPEKGPAPTPLPGQLNEPGRLALIGHLLLTDRAAEALEVARRADATPGGRLRGLILYAEWGPDPGAAAEAAAGFVKKDAGAPPFAVLRMVQLAAAAGKADAARALAEAIADEGLRAWARGEVIRCGSTPSASARAEDDAAEAKDNPKDARAGQAWGRFWLARHNTRVSGDGGKEGAAVNLWPAWAKPFGLAGIALGLKDR